MLCLPNWFSGSWRDCDLPVGAGAAEEIAKLPGLLPHLAKVKEAHDPTADRVGRLIHQILEAPKYLILRQGGAPLHPVAVPHEGAAAEDVHTHLDIYHVMLGVEEHIVDIGLYQGVVEHELASGGRLTLDGEGVVFGELDAPDIHSPLGGRGVECASQLGDGSLNETDVVPLTLLGVALGGDHAGPVDVGADDCEDLGDVDGSHEWWLYTLSIPDT